MKVQFWVKNASLKSSLGSKITDQHHQRGPVFNVVEVFSGSIVREDAIELQLNDFQIPYNRIVLRLGILQRLDFFHA